MARGAAANGSRPLRADARRNRDAVLAAARETFEEDGALASLDGIALRAGVGNATLYRNFPTREDLLAAVIETNVEHALAEAEELSRTLGPREALAEWLVLLTWQLRTWHDLPTCVATSGNEPGSSLNDACAPLRARTSVLLEAARASGDAVDAVSTADVFELVTLLSWGVDRYGDDEAAARRRVAVATSGLFA